MEIEVSLHFRWEQLKCFTLLVGFTICFRWILVSGRSMSVNITSISPYKWGRASLSKKEEQKNNIEYIESVYNRKKEILKIILSKYKRL